MTGALHLPEPLTKSKAEGSLFLATAATQDCSPKGTDNWRRNEAIRTSTALWPARLSSKWPPWSLFVHVWSGKCPDFENGLSSSIWARASLLSQLSCCEYFGVSVHRGRLSHHFNLATEEGIHLLPQSGSYFVPSGHNQAPLKQQTTLISRLRAGLSSWTSLSIYPWWKVLEELIRLFGVLGRRGKEPFKG